MFSHHQTCQLTSSGNGYDQVHVPSVYAPLVVMQIKAGSTLHPASFISHAGFRSHEDVFVTCEAHATE